MPLMRSSRRLAMYTAGHSEITFEIEISYFFNRKQLEENIKGYRNALGRLNHRIGFAIKVGRKIFILTTKNYKSLLTELLDMFCQ